MTASKYLLLILTTAALSPRGAAQKVANTPEALRERAEEVDAECLDLNAEAERQRVRADSLLEELPSLPEGLVLDSPYSFHTFKRLAVYSAPFSSEVSFRVSRGQLLTVVRLISRVLTSTYYAEVLDEAENRSGFIPARYAGPWMMARIDEHRDAPRRLREQRFAIEQVIDAANRDLVSCRNRAGDLRNRAARVEDENRRVENERRQVEEFYASTPDVLIDRFYPGRPNSADGVDLHVRWRFLNPNKMIRYIRFTARPYNRVGDVRRGQIGGHSDFTGYITGPIDASTRARNSTWGTAWYNSDISCVRLTRVRIEYTDGTSYTYVRELPSILAEGVTNSCTMEAQRRVDLKLNGPRP